LFSVHTYIITSASSFRLLEATLLGVLACCLVLSNRVLGTLLEGRGNEDAIVSTYAAVSHYVVTVMVETAALLFAGQERAGKTFDPHFEQGAAHSKGCSRPRVRSAHVSGSRLRLAVVERKKVICAVMKILFCTSNATHFGGHVYIER